MEVGDWIFGSVGRQPRPSLCLAGLVKPCNSDTAQTWELVVLQVVLVATPLLRQYSVLIVEGLSWFVVLCTLFFPNCFPVRLQYH